jgi:hypothetical protein
MLIECPIDIKLLKTVAERVLRLAPLAGPESDISLLCGGVMTLKEMPDGGPHRVGEKCPNCERRRKGLREAQARFRVRAKAKAKA